MAADERILTGTNAHIAYCSSCRQTVPVKKGLCEALVCEEFHCVHCLNTIPEEDVAHNYTLIEPTEGDANA